MVNHEKKIDSQNRYMFMNHVIPNKTKNFYILIVQMLSPSYLTHINIKLCLFYQSGRSNTSIFMSTSYVSPEHLFTYKHVL